MNKKQKIINRIYEKDKNWYRMATRVYLTEDSSLNNFEVALFSEIVYEMIVNHKPLEMCFDEISKEYKVNCERIAFFAIMPNSMYKKSLYLQNPKVYIDGFFEIVKNYVVRETFRGNLKVPGYNG